MRNGRALADGGGFSVGVTWGARGVLDGVVRGGDAPAAGVAMVRMNGMRKGWDRTLRMLALAGFVVCAAAVFVVPYHVPVTETVSESYRVGFNNHAALLLFLLAAALFSVGVDGLGFPDRAEDRPLPRWVLYAAMLAAGLLCIAWRVHRQHQPLGSESGYLINRQIQMAAGLHVYKDLEFIYGPLLIYPGYWLLAGTKLSPLLAYMTTWTVFWVVGTGMLWFMLARLALPCRHRVLLFVFLFYFTLGNVRSEGAHYTPLRMFCAGFFSVAVAFVWQRTGDARRTAATMMAAIAVGFAVSPEQGTALALGLSAYALLLGWKARARFPLLLAGAVPVWALLVVALASRAGVLRSMHGFAQGGNNFPLLASPLTVFLLAVYLCSLAVLFRALRRGAWDSPVLPLGLCGVPMLSSAFGRCDSGHLNSAVPLYLLGLFWVCSRPWAFRAWVVLYAFFFLDIGGAIRSLAKVKHPAQAVAALPGEPTPVTPSEGIPGGRSYFAPFALPTGVDGVPLWSAQSGYFYGVQNVLTPQDIAVKAREIRERRAPYLVLPDSPGAPEMLFWESERNLEIVRVQEGSFRVPAVKHALPSTADVTEAITSLYERTPMAEAGWRVWKLRQP